MSKPLRDSNSGCTDHKPDTVSTRLWSKLYVAVDKILLIKQNVVSIRGQPFCDDVLFHLNNSFHLSDH